MPKFSMFLLDRRPTLLGICRISGISFHDTLLSFFLGLRWGLAVAFSGLASCVLGICNEVNLKGGGEDGWGLLSTVAAPVAFTGTLLAVRTDRFCIPLGMFEVLCSKLGDWTLG